MNESFERVVTGQCEGECRKEDTEGQRDGSPWAAADVADERREDNQGRRQQSRQSEPVQELGIAHPGSLRDGVTLQKGNDGVRTAERQETGFKAGPEQVDKRDLAESRRRCGREGASEVSRTLTEPDDEEVSDYAGQS